MKTRKILDVNWNGRRVVCIHVERPGEWNPFRLYQITEDGGKVHRHLLVKYADFQSVLWAVWQHADWFENTRREE